MQLTALIASTLLLPALAVAQQASRKFEHEPNGTVASATIAALGDTLLGEITTEDDMDYFAIDVPAGTLLRMARRTIDHACLIDLDGVTTLGCFRDNEGGQDLAFPVTAAGRYVIQLYASRPDPEVVHFGPYTIAIAAESFALGSGDPPVTLVAFPERVWTDYRLAAGFVGETYILLPGPQATILRLDRSGVISTFASGMDASRGFAMDAFGNLLVTGPDNGENTIWSISPAGAVTKFAEHLGQFYNHSGFSIAIGPDGDVWAGEVETIWRYSPTGELRATTFAPGCGFNSIAVSPRGVLHINGYSSGCRGLFAFPATGIKEIARDTVGDLAFDRDGNLYVGVPDDAGPMDQQNPHYGHVTMFDSAYRVVGQIAHVPYLSGLQFLRDAQGNMTSRLITAQLGIKRIVELNGAQTRVPGWGPPRFHRADPVAPLPAAVASAYTDTLRLPGVIGALVWTIASGVLPPGITLSPAGVLAGTPERAGTFTLSLRADRESEAWFGEATIQVAPLSVSVAQIADAILGGQPLTPDLVEYLDGHGNKNGQLDAGDLRAYLRAQGLLNSTTSPAAARPN